MRLFNKNRMEESIRANCKSEGNGVYRSPTGIKIILASEVKDRGLQGLEPPSVVIDEYIDYEGVLPWNQPAFKYRDKP